MDEVSEEEDGAADKSIIDLIFKGKFYEICSNGKILCDILIDLLYDKPNAKGVVWDMCGDIIIDNLLQQSGLLSFLYIVIIMKQEHKCNHLLILLDYMLSLLSPKCDNNHQKHLCY